MIKPTQNRILVQRDEAATQTELGIYIPDIALRSETTGKVIVQGKGTKENIPVGSKVLFGLHDGVPISPEHCDGLERCILLSEDVIRAVIN